MTNLDELEALARAVQADGWYTSVDAPRSDDRYLSPDDEAYIKALSPDTVLSLIAEVRKAQQERDDFLAMLLHAEDEWLMMAEDEGPRGQGWQSQELEEFRAKIKALRARTALGDTDV